MAKRGLFDQKSMFSIISRTAGVVHIDCALKGETINNENCLKPLVKVLQIDRQKCDRKKSKKDLREMVRSNAS